MQTRVSLKYFVNNCRYNWSCNYFIVFFFVSFMNKQTQKLQKLAAVTNYSKSVNRTWGLGKANVTYTNGDTNLYQQRY